MASDLVTLPLKDVMLSAMLMVWRFFSPSYGMNYSVVISLTCNVFIVIFNDIYFIFRWDIKGTEVGIAPFSPAVPSYIYETVFVITPYIDRVLTLGIH